MSRLGMKTLRNLLGVMGKVDLPDGKSRLPTLGEFSSNPLAAAGFVAPAAAFLSNEVVGPIGGSVYDVVTGRPLKKEREQLETGMSNYTESLYKKLEDSRKKEEMERNMMAVQKSAPHLYNQVMAGRRLPQGSIVIGGQPRQDLMEELASYMGNLPASDPAFS
jgi:hypothetical protein